MWKIEDRVSRYCALQVYYSMITLNTHIHGIYYLEETALRFNYWQNNTDNRPQRDPKWGLYDHGICQYACDSMQSQTYADLQSSSVDCMAPSVCSSALVGSCQTRPNRKRNLIMSLSMIVEHIRVPTFWTRSKSRVHEQLWNRPLSINSCRGVAVKSLGRA